MVRKHSAKVLTLRNVLMFPLQVGKERKKQSTSFSLVGVGTITAPILST